MQFNYLSIKFIYCIICYKHIHILHWANIQVTDSKIYKVPFIRATQLSTDNVQTIYKRGILC
jgi:hypothetical protein